MAVFGQISDFLNEIFLDLLYAFVKRFIMKTTEWTNSPLEFHRAAQRPGAERVTPPQTLIPRGAFHVGHPLVTLSITVPPPQPPQQDS